MSTHFPHARVHAVDVSAPALRYAHARSELSGRAVHFRQASAEELPWEDDSVDLVCSHILMHETSRPGAQSHFS
jgi:ubiquinone/menaquinone biosynthesis C-methylase UbiE